MNVSDKRRMVNCERLLILLLLILGTNGCHKENSSTPIEKTALGLNKEKNKIADDLILDISKLKKMGKSNGKKDQRKIKKRIPSGAVWIRTEDFVDCCYYFGALDMEGERNGPWRAYYRSGIVHMEMFFSHGQMNGLMKGFHENGMPMLEGRWENNKRVGTWKFWNPDKVLWKKGKFINDKMNGEWIVNEQGKKLICEYKDEVRLSCKSIKK